MMRMKLKAMRRFVFILLSLVGVIAVGCNNEQPSTPVIKLSHSTIDAWYDADTYIFDVYANCEWRATSDSDWAVIETGANAKGDSIVKIAVAKNDSAELRVAHIRVEAVEDAGLFEMVTITQSVVLDEYYQITYTTTYNDVLELNPEGFFDAEIASNTYENGVGVIRFATPLTKVGEMAFCECETLESIVLPNSVDAIGGWAFFGCVYLEDVTMSNRVKSIGDAAFSSCSRLQSITLPECLNYLGDSVFYGCSGMSAYYGKYASADNRCLVVDNVLRHFAPKGIKEYEIPNGITTIAFAAFYESLRLQSVTIPASVTTIEDWAFYYCESLKTVYCKPTTPPALGESVFDNSDDGNDKPIGCKIYVPEISVDAYKEAQNWSRYKSYIYGDGRY